MELKKDSRLSAYVVAFGSIFNDLSLVSVDDAEIDDTVTGYRRLYSMKQVISHLREAAKLLQNFATDTDPEVADFRTRLRPPLLDDTLALIEGRAEREYWRQFLKPVRDVHWHYDVMALVRGINRRDSLNTEYVESPLDFSFATDVQLVVASLGLFTNEEIETLSDETYTRLMGERLSEVISICRTLVDNILRFASYATRLYADQESS